MIRMFVSDQNPVEVIDGHFESCQPRQRFAFPKASINKESGPRRLEQREVTRAARRQYGHTQPDCWLLKLSAKQERNLILKNNGRQQ